MSMYGELLGKAADGFFSGLKQIFAVAVGGTAIIGVGATWMLTSDDVDYDLNKSTRAAIDDGTVSAEMICREQIKGQTALADEFSRRGYDGPIVTYSMEECLTAQRALSAPRP